MSERASSFLMAHEHSYTTKNRASI